MGKGYQILPVDVAEITERVAAKEPLMRVLAELDIAPTEFFEHLDKTPGDKILFETARKIAVEVLVDECEGLIERADSKLEFEKAKARVGYRQWLAEKIVPSTYGSKIQHDHSHTINIKSILDEGSSRSKDAIEAHATRVLEIEKLSTNPPDLSTGGDEDEDDEIPKPEDLF